jgi:hypothetical protein
MQSGLKSSDRLLEIIQFQNPGGFEDTDDWAPRIAGGTFPLHSGFEWKQVLDSEDEYDQLNSVGATGWAIAPEIAEKDTPGNHPFGFDWEFDCVLDAPYTFLLAKGNTKPDDLTPTKRETVGSIERDNHFQVPGVLGVEWDKGLVPQAFQNQVQDGDRVAVFGRWIVDCGHDDPYQSEIHPPLLMASASVYKEPNGNEFTRAVFASRPYLVGQTFSVDTADIYNDSAANDGHYFGHLLKEVIKAETIVLSNLVEAHPKIKSYPFRGVHLLQMVVRNPQPSPNTTVHLYDLAVSFHFTVRGGCAVQVIPNDESSVRVLVLLNDAGYTPPALPHRNGHRYSVGELNDLGGAGFWTKLSEGIFAVVNNPIATLILGRGLETDEYDPLPAVNLFDLQLAVVNASSSNIPAGIGISQNDSQPYPVFGWLDVKWVRFDTVATR